jgi:hypothetical protein
VEAESSKALTLEYSLLALTCVSNGQKLYSWSGLSERRMDSPTSEGAVAKERVTHLYWVTVDCVLSENTLNSV